MDGALFSPSPGDVRADPSESSGPAASSQLITDLVSAGGATGLEVPGLGPLARACPLATMLVDFDGCVRLWNPAAERAFGWEASEVVGRLHPAIPQERRPEYLSMLERVRRGETFSAVPAVRQRKDGTLISVELWAVAIADSDGNARCLSMVADVTEREQAARYRDLLSAAGEVLAGSLDYEATLQSLAHLAVPALADWCIIDLVSEDETLRRIGAAHVDPKKAEVTRELHRRYPPSVDSPSPAGRALRDGRSVLLPELPDEVLATTVRDPEHARLVRELGILSAMAVPLVARGRTLGVITLSTADSGRRYGEAELSTAEELARRAAYAVDNARLYQSERQSRELAERALERVSRLQALTAGLSARRSPREAATFVVAEAIQSLGSRTGAVGLLVDGGAAFEVQTVAGYAPGMRTSEALRDWDRFPVAAHTAWGDVVRTNGPVFVESVAARLARYPELRGTQEALSLGASAALPLRIGGRVFGVLYLSFVGDRVLSAEDRGFLMAVADQCAQAMERGYLDAAERAARQAAQLAADRRARLQAVTAALVGPLTLPEMASAIVEEIKRAIGARSGAIVRLVEDGATFEVLHKAGYDEQGDVAQGVTRAWRRFPASLSSPVADAVRTGQPVVLEGAAARRVRYPHLAEVQVAIGEGATVSLPLAVEGRPLGGLHVSFYEGRAFDEEERDFLVAVARQCALGLERARLYDAERTARARAEASERNLAFLAEASDILASSLDYHSTLESVARLAVPRLADWCLVYVREDDDQFHCLAVCHQNPEREHLARMLIERYPLNPAKPVGLPETFRTGEPTIVPELTDEELASAARDAEHLRLLRELTPRSYLAVPLQARGRVLGAVLMVFGESGRRYSQADLPLVQELARRAAVAVDNAGLYAAEQRARGAAEQAVRVRDEFISIASHELKTPITRLQLSTQLPLRLLARKGAVDPDYVRRSLSAIDQQSHKLGGLVNQLLDVSRLESGKLAIERSAVDVVAIVKEVLGTARALTDRHEITYRGPETLPASADPVRLEQVLTNLVDNAVKYSPEGGPIEVEVECPDPETARIAVTDHGIGIAPEHRSRVFDRFYQARPGDQREGMGLGLYVSHEIVRLHGGSIVLECPPVGGARFVVTLPTRQGPAGPRSNAAQAA